MICCSSDSHTLFKNWRDQRGLIGHVGGSSRPLRFGDYTFLPVAASFDPDHGALQRSDQNVHLLVVLITESIMEKRNSVGAVYAESLVFESNLALTVVPAADPGNAAIKPAQWIAAWSAAALVCERVGTGATPPSRVVH